MRQLAELSGGVDVRGSSVEILFGLSPPFFSSPSPSPRLFCVQVQDYCVYFVFCVYVTVQCESFCVLFCFVKIVICHVDHPPWWSCVDMLCNCLVEACVCFVLFCFVRCSEDSTSFLVPLVYYSFAGIINQCSVVFQNPVGDGLHALQPMPSRISWVYNR